MVECSTCKRHFRSTEVFLLYLGKGKLKCPHCGKDALSKEGVDVTTMSDDESSKYVVALLNRIYNLADIESLKINKQFPCQNCGKPFQMLCPTPRCGGVLSHPRQFNLMFKTFMGHVEDSASITYLRPETAQGIFVNFENVLQ